MTVGKRTVIDLLLFLMFVVWAGIIAWLSAEGFRRLLPV
jgi:hypothetical protein